VMLPLAQQGITVYPRSVYSESFRPALHEKSVR
jgi:hypothetical protein